MKRRSSQRGTAKTGLCVGAAADSTGGLHGTGVQLPSLGAPGPAHHGHLGATQRSGPHTEVTPVRGGQLGGQPPGGPGG